jgi:hypothetical protein
VERLRRTNNMEKKIAIKIEINGNNCGFSCPFKSGEANKDACKCSLFNEDLKTDWHYNSIDGVKRCWKCISMEDK